ncbi:MAG: hypothetical protein WCJ07_00445 [Verrucomicrobiota bacterium]
MPKISAKDQHGKEFLFTNNLQVLLIVTEMSTAKTANVKLAEQAEGFLEKHSAAYLMDIHAMPGIARYFALPKMRKYPQRIILIESEEALMAFPAKSGCVTLLTLSSAGKIEKIEYWNPDQNPVSKYLP